MLTLPGPLRTKATEDHRKLVSALITVLACISLEAYAPAQDATPSSCSDCHNGAADAKVPGPPYELLFESAHDGHDCTDCHESISMEDLDPTSSKPHGEFVEPVACGECHEDEAEIYQKHGLLEVGKDPDLPKCWSCHGTHEILPSSNRQSHVHPANLQSTCRVCHADMDLVEKHDSLRDKPIELYLASVHGLATRKGVYTAATCNDCHSATDAEGNPTAHRILSLADPESTIHHFNVPDTCGQCHKSVTQDYWEGIHGQYVRRGVVDSPVCTHCHGEHGIISPDDPRSPVSPAQVAEQTCSPCHESVVLNQRYGLARGRPPSYIDSYHGLKSKAGDTTVGNCASCHEAHRILPSTDPTSSIHPSNLRATCGECHPGISEELAQTPIHSTATGIYTGWPEFFRKLYIVIIIVTIGLMLLHNVGHWVRRVRQMRTLPYVQRLSINEVIQHWLLMLSFIVLVISGFSLRFSEAWWVRILFGWVGGFEVRGIIHRVSAVVMIVCSVWHLAYLFTAGGRQCLRDMLPGRSDFADSKHNLLYFLGLKREEPRFKRFSYIEKAEYWALVWGTMIMAGTGLLLWFDDYFVERWHFPKVVLEVALVIHYYEAWLAFLAILVWHIYGTVFNPSVYPMNPAWLAGKMPKDMYTHEHPEGPRLKAFVQRKLYEEEEPEPLETAPALGEPAGALRDRRSAATPSRSPVAIPDDGASRDKARNE